MHNLYFLRSMHQLGKRRSHKHVYRPHRCLDNPNHPRIAHYRPTDLEALPGPEILLQRHVRRRDRPQTSPTRTAKSSPNEPIPLTDVDPLDRGHRRPAHDKGQETAIKGLDSRHRKDYHLMSVSLYNRLLNGKRRASGPTKPLQEIIQQLQPLQQTRAQQVPSDQPQAEQLRTSAQQEEERY